MSGDGGEVPAQPTLRDGDVVVRQWRYADAESAFRQHNEETACWFGFKAGPPTLEDQRAWIEQVHTRYAAGREAVHFAVERSGELAGAVDVKQRGSGLGKLTWVIFPAHRGMRAATRSLRALVDYCFEDLGLARVEAQVEVGRTASLRTAGRAGLRREGVARSQRRGSDRRRDLVTLARLAGDPPPTTTEGFRGVLNATLPTKRVIAQGLLRNTIGKVLYCGLTYKREWDLPGGVVDPGESPATAVVREVKEELGIDVHAGQLRIVDWMPPWHGWDDACLFVFDLGTYSPEIVEEMVFEPREIAAVHWCSPEDAHPHIPPYARTLLEHLLKGPAATTYLEDGRPV